MDTPNENVQDAPLTPRPVADAPPTVINTTAPIPIAVLKRKFTENIRFVVDYEGSRFKGKVLITYLTNLDISCELQFSSGESILELVKDYLYMGAVVNLPQLEEVVINVLLAATGKPYYLDFDPTNFIEENREILEIWMQKISMVPVYALHAYPVTSDLVANYEEIHTDDMRGINFVKIIGHYQFPMLVSDIPEDAWCWNKTFFNEYCFSGQNLFHFFQSENNPYFVGIVALSEAGKLDELQRAADAQHQKNLAILKGIMHVPST